MTALNVIARNPGQYGDKHRRPGEPFTLDAPEHFAGNWMEAVGWTPPASTPQPKPAAPTVRDMLDASERIEHLAKLLDAEIAARRAAEAEAAAHKSRVVDLEIQLAAKATPAPASVPATPPPAEKPATTAEPKPPKPAKPTET